VSARLSGSDWEEVLSQGHGHRWWALPPLQLCARYYPQAVPADVLTALARQCPWTLRQTTRRRRISDASLSYPWVMAFPGITWSQSLTEIVNYINYRVWPPGETQRTRKWRSENDPVAAPTQWVKLSQPQRVWRWITTRPLRVETMYAVQMALTRA
jgi:hypothetical protein